MLAEAAIENSGTARSRSPVPGDGLDHAKSKDVIVIRLSWRAQTARPKPARTHRRHMRESITTGLGDSSGLPAGGIWLDLEELATAELSSEDPEHVFEQALRSDTVDGWRAATPGPQLIRLRFNRPQAVRRIHLQFQEERVERSQEIAIFATSTGSQRRELVRQQWVFSPNEATTETEEYFFDLQDVLVVDLEIDPGRHDKSVFASLKSIQIG